MPPQKRFQDLLFVDTETTGLDPSKHELLEVAAIRTTPDGLTVLSTFQAKVRPLHIETAEPKALQINGYSEEEWTEEKCVPLGSMVDAIQKMANQTVMVGQNVSFDESFLSPVFKSFGMKPPWGYHKVDTIALAWPLFQYSELEGLSLEKLCRFLKVDNMPGHRAMPDALACRDVYLKLMAKWQPSAS